METVIHLQIFTSYYSRTYSKVFRMLGNLSVCRPVAKNRHMKFKAILHGNIAAHYQYICFLFMANQRQLTVNAVLSRLTGLVHLCVLHWHSNSTACRNIYEGNVS